MTRIALIGYGKMGRMIERLAPEAGCEVVSTFDIDRPLTAEALQVADVAIEFTEPGAVADHLEIALAAQVPLVIGTTGWYDRLPAFRARVLQANGRVVWAANFSIGVNVFTRVVAEAAKQLAAHDAFGAYAWEVHHAAKKDAPSGTLIRLVDAMREAGYARDVDVSSNRAGMFPGTHEIAFDSAEDTITLRHTARSREGFARGALEAAKRIQSRDGFFEFSDLLFG